MEEAGVIWSPFGVGKKKKKKEWKKFIVIPEGYVHYFIENFNIITILVLEYELVELGKLRRIITMFLLRNSLRDNLDSPYLLIEIRSSNLEG